jgi:transcriptional regulator with XRE-family HTH domain
MNTTGEKIIEARKQKGLSQEALAAVANISLSTIQRIEKGKVQPRSFTLKTLAVALKIDFSELISQKNIVQGVAIDNSKQELPALKSMLVYGMLGTLLPLFNIIIPFVFRKKEKIILANNSAAGSILSFVEHFCSSGYFFSKICNLSNYWFRRV